MPQKKKPLHSVFSMSRTQLQPLIGAHNGKKLLLTAEVEEVLQADIEHHGDTGQCRERRHHLAGFELRQHGSGQTGVFAQVDQGDFLPQA
jgi:hypothetical protein